MDELLAEILNLQKGLYSGLKDDKETNLEWLNENCVKFTKLFKVLHKFLVFEITDHKSNTVETCFLCCSQIITCIRFLEKTLVLETKDNKLKTSRQCFLDRILWCLARLKSEAQSVNDNVILDNSTTDNFVFLMDLVLDNLSMFIAIDNNPNVTNNAENNAELMMESTKVRSIIDQLLSNTLSFANIALESDKNALTTLSQKVLKECMQFEAEFSLSEPGKHRDKTTQRLKAISLENALYNLENLINDCLLRLVYEVFYQLSLKPFNNLKNVADDPDKLDQEIEKFDLLIDRVIQIGLFGISFVKDDVKICSVIRSCLASVESVDSYMIPSLTYKDDSENSTEILQEHFEEEINIMQHYIHRIIDTNAFCSSLIDQLQVIIDSSKKSFDKQEITNIVKKAEILLCHFHINSESLSFNNDKISKFYFNDFKLMIKECEAILNFHETIENENQRILKRLSILNTTLKKLQNAICLKKSKENSVSTSEAPKLIPKTEEKSEKISTKYNEYFSTLKPSALGSVLYETKRNSIRLSKSKSQATLMKLDLSTIRKPKLKKRKSLRMAIFKRNHETDMSSQLKNDDSLDLQITEILEKLTDLSCTLGGNGKNAD